MTPTKWDYRYLDLARLVASWSKDPSTQTGAVIIRSNNTVCSVGFNGFPRGVDDSPEIYADRKEKYQRVVHCEMNAILNAREPVEGYTLYTWPFLTCDRCAAHVIQAGIQEVICPKCPPELEERWGDSFVRSRDMYEQAGVEVYEIDYPNPENSGDTLTQFLQRIYS